jgi:circadian clock protein KaiA
VANANVSSIESNLANVLPQDRYTVTVVSDLEALVVLLTKSQNAQDCLVMFGDIARDLEDSVDYLGMSSVFVPTVLVLDDLYEHGFPQCELVELKGESKSEPKDFYRAIISITFAQLQALPDVIDQAIATFIKISPQISHQVYVNIPNTPVSASFNVQQQRLAEKLNERLGYLGVYYKRDSRLFLRNLSPADKKDYLDRLKEKYRMIVLEYFLDKTDALNQNIDEFVNLSFFADISVSQVLEIHMDLMEDFAKQLRLEGRNDEVLLDYRITLIDMIAHLCELYRRSIPRS